jgi:hypothetical protein
MRSRAVTRLIWTLLAVPLAGCSISDSSGSLSRSSHSSSGSSDNSSTGAAEHAYRDDVTDYTRTWAASGRGDFRGFQAEVARIAEDHGITNWEENPATYTAIGEGLGRAKVSGTDLAAYKQGLSGADQQKADPIQQGYDSVR